MYRILKILKIFKRNDKKLETTELDLIGISGRIYDYRLYKAKNGFIRNRATDEIMEIQWYDWNND